MKRSPLPALLTLLAFAAPALALNSRSAVSVNGLDTNPCTPASPCRSFTAAIAQTNAGGEIIALDSAGYGPFTLTSSMTVSGAPGVRAALTVASGDGITINAAITDTVTIRNLVLIGAGGVQGIVQSDASAVRVLDCAISGFSASAVISSVMRLIVDHCFLVDNAAGVTLNANSAEGVIVNSLIDNCSIGVSLLGSAFATITNCTISGCFSECVQLVSPAGARVSAVVENSTLTFSPIGIAAQTSGTNTFVVVYLANNQFSFCSLGVQATGSVTAKSFSNNRFPEVTLVGTLSPMAFQ